MNNKNKSERNIIIKLKKITFIIGVIFLFSGIVLLVAGSAIAGKICDVSYAANVPLSMTEYTKVLRVLVSRIGIGAIINGASLFVCSIILAVAAQLQSLNRNSGNKSNSEE